MKFREWEFADVALVCLSSTVSRGGKESSQCKPEGVGGPQTLGCILTLVVRHVGSK